MAAVERYKYKAINLKGRSVRGVISAANEVDLHNRLQNSGLELLHCSAISKHKGPLAGLVKLNSIKIRDLIQLFMHMEQMQSAGVPLLDALGDIRDTTDNDHLRDIMSEVFRDVSEGSSLSEAFSQHPKIFNNLYISLIGAGEETGDLTKSYLQLVKYLKWVDQMQAKVRKATRYPTILVLVVILTVVVMMGYVVPQIVGFVKNMDMELPFYTQALIMTSEFFVAYWWAILSAPVAFVFTVLVASRLSETLAYKFDEISLKLPVFGVLIRKINVARFSQTFGALFASGIDVLQSLEHSRKTVNNRAISDALEGIYQQVQAGSPLSEAFNASGEFPSMVVRMLKVGEESGNLTVVLDQVADFYTSDVDEAVQGLISMIEPFLTGILGGMILWIAAGVFGPIYSSFGELDF